MVGFPLLLIPLAIYNIIVFLMPSVSFTDPLVKLTLMSGAEWTVTLSDVLLTLGILLLLAEVIQCVVVVVGQRGRATGQRDGPGHRGRG